MYKALMRRRGVGFTLIELLVVVSIIALLVSILLPALGQARKRARGVICQTRVKDIYMMMTHYSMDNGELPDSPYPRWYAVLSEYYQRNPTNSSGADESAYAYVHFHCPEMEKYSEEGNYTIDYATWGLYKYNIFFTRRWSGGMRDQGVLLQDFKWKSTDQADMPSELPLMVDGHKLGIHCNGGYPEDNASENTAWPDNPYYHNNWGAGVNHQGKMSMIFCDGHSELTWWWPYAGTVGEPLATSQEYTQYWHPKREIVSDFGWEMVR